MKSDERFPQSPAPFPRPLSLSGKSADLPNYFLDTSALAKRYHKENGSEYMDRVLEQPGSRSLISNLSIVELESVLAIKMRTGEINLQSWEIARRRFRADLARERLLVAPSMNEGHFQSARKLLVRYGAAEGLRTLDALQLAMALDLRQMGTLQCSSRPTKDSAATSTVM